MQPQLDVIVVQPDEVIGGIVVDAMAESGHTVTRLSAASWAVRGVREDPPDVVVLERRAVGFEQLLDALDSLGVAVVVTRFSEIPGIDEWLAGPQARALVRRVEQVVLRGP
jgi:hypothetical protein